AGIANAFKEMSQVPGAGVALGTLLLVGLVAAWGPLTSAERRRCAAAPAALLIGAILFLLIISQGRAYGFDPHADPTASSRYIHLVSALALPAIAVAADAVARRWRLMAPAALALLVIGVPGNVKAFDDHSKAPGTGDPFQRAFRKHILSVARVPVAREVPRWVRPDPFFAHAVTIGWLLDGVASGRVPDPGPIDSVAAANATLGLALHQSHANKGAKPCQKLRSPVTRRIAKDQSIGISRGVLLVVYLPDGGRASLPRRIDARKGQKLVALAGPLTLRLSSADRNRPVMLCA
ncbi:MAG: hypothetical protein ACJ73V_01550, partial [Acidimicrobiia bacterium]